MSEASPLPGVRGSLAWEAADDPVDGGEVVGASGSDVVVNRDAWPSTGEQSSTEFVALDEPGVVDACLVESCVEQACA